MKGGAVVEALADYELLLEEMQLAELRGYRSRKAKAKAQEVDARLEEEEETELPWFLQDEGPRLPPPRRYCRVLLLSRRANPSAGGPSPRPGGPPRVTPSVLLVSHSRGRSRDWRQVSSAIPV